jgi:hypothetical protein
MPSVIVLTRALKDPAKIHRSDEPYLLAGMRMFGNQYKATFDNSSAQNAAASIKDVFAHVMSQGCHVYYFSNALARFVRLTAPTQNGAHISFNEERGGNFTIEVGIDSGGNNPRMNLAAPIGDHTTYLDLFSKLAAADWEQNTSSDFLAASILIGR